MTLNASIKHILCAALIAIPCPQIRCAAAALPAPMNISIKTENIMGYTVITALNSAQEECGSAVLTEIAGSESQLESLHVKPEFREKKVGKQLIQEALLRQKIYVNDPKSRVLVFTALPFDETLTRFELVSIYQKYGAKESPHQVQRGTPMSFLLEGPGLPPATPQ